MAKTSVAVFIRTNCFDPAVQKLADALIAGLSAQVHIVCDERKAPIDTAGFPKISLNKALIDRWGFATLRKDWAWSCGDFCLYAARDTVPEAEWYVLVENDVYVAESAASELHRILKDTSADALACALGRKKKPTGLSKDLEHVGVPNDGGCIFSLCCVKGHIIDKMIENRRKVQAQRGLRVNDEGVLAGTVLQHGFPYGDLFEIAPQLFSPRLFATNPPHLLEGMPIDEEPHSVVHPAIPFSTVLERIQTGEKKYTRHRLRRVLREAPVELRQEINKALDEKATSAGIHSDHAKFLSPDIKVVCSEINKRQIFFAVQNPRDEIQKYHLQGTFYEPEELKIIADHFPKRGRYCDIGANVGNHAVFVGLFLDPSAIVVVEPNPPAIALLKTNIFLNRLDDVVDLSKLGFGLSNQAFDSASMKFGVRNLGGARLVRSGGDLSVRIGDEHLAGHDFDFIKIDVEGSEMEVLDGLEQTISRCRPTMFIEVDKKNYDAFDQWVAASRYKIEVEFQRYPTNKNFLVRSLDG